jgi:cell division protein FtsZ
MGGGTGTGAAPIVAEVAKDMGALTVGIVTMPFKFEGPVREQNAEKGIKALRERVDTILVIPNDKIFQIIEKNTPVVSGFKAADSILLEATRGISDLINVHGYINLDFADIRTIMAGMGDALMGTGVGIGENRAIVASEQAITSPLLDGADIRGARGVLINITGGPSMTMHEVGEASTLIRESVGEDANVILGMVVDENLQDELRVTVIATGFNKEAKQADRLQRTVSTPVDAYNPEDFTEIDKPAFLRNNLKVDNKYPGAAGENILSLEEETKTTEENLEIPAYLRKTAD